MTKKIYRLAFAIRLCKFFNEFSVALSLFAREVFMRQKGDCKVNSFLVLLLIPLNSLTSFTILFTLLIKASSLFIMPSASCFVTYFLFLPPNPPIACVLPHGKIPYFLNFIKIFLPSGVRCQFGFMLTLLFGGNLKLLVTLFLLLNPFAVPVWRRTLGLARSIRIISFFNLLLLLVMCVLCNRRTFFY